LVAADGLRPIFAVARNVLRDAMGDPALGGWPARRANARDERGDERDRW